MAKSKHTCCWVKIPASSGGGDPLLRRDAVFCGKPTSYRMERDDDDNLVRRYLSFCDEHQVIVDAQDKDAWEEDDA